MSATKQDDGKPRFDLLPSPVLTEITEALSFGAVKYCDRNYLGLRWGRIFAALMRHSWAWWGGEENDSETGLSHLAHAGACLVMLRHCQVQGTGVDDREVSKPVRVLTGD